MDKVIQDRIDNVRCPICDKELKDQDIQYIKEDGKNIPLCAIHPTPENYGKQTKNTA